MKVLIIGPFPLPIDGCSYANDVLRRNIQKRNILCKYIDTSSNVISSNQGSAFSLVKTVAFLKSYLQVYKVILSTIIYFTIGQTFFGILKYSPFILLSILFKKPYVIHLHGNYLGHQYNSLKGIKKKIIYFLISNASACVVLSKSLKRNFHNLLPDSKVHVVENFVEENLYGINEKKRSDKVRILYLSNLMKEKGISEVLEALLELKNINVDFEASIAGAIEKDLALEVKTKIEKLGTNVKYLGTITGDAKKKVLSDANVFILPTYYKMEGQPISILEGLATGNIIVTTKHAGIPDIINQSNGFFVKPKSSTDIVNCIIDIKSNLSSYVNKFSDYNQSYAAANFTEEAFANKLVRIFNEISKS